MFGGEIGNFWWELLFAQDFRVASMSLDELDKFAQILFLNLSRSVSGLRVYLKRMCEDDCVHATDVKYLYRFSEQKSTKKCWMRWDLDDFTSE